MWHMSCAKRAQPCVPAILKSPPLCYTWQPCGMLTFPLHVLAFTDAAPSPSPKPSPSPSPSPAPQPSPSPAPKPSPSPSPSPSPQPPVSPSPKTPSPSPSPQPSPSPAPPPSPSPQTSPCKSLASRGPCHDAKCGTSQSAKAAAACAGSN